MAFQKDNLTVAGLKMLAKDLRTALEDVTGVAIPAHQAQEVAARQFGYPTWHEAYAQAKRVSVSPSAISSSPAESFQEAILKGVRDLTPAQASLAQQQADLALLMGYASWDAYLASVHPKMSSVGAEPEWLTWAKMSLARGQAWTSSFLDVPEQGLHASLIAGDLDGFWRQMTDYDQGVTELAPLVAPLVSAQAHRLAKDVPTTKAWVRRTQQRCLCSLLPESIDHDPTGQVFAHLWDHLEADMDGFLRRDLIRHAIDHLAPLDHLILRQEAELREYDDEFFVEQAIEGAHDAIERQRVERLLTLNSDPDKIPHALAYAALELVDEDEASLLIGHLVYRFVPIERQRAMLDRATKGVDKEIANRGMDVLWQSHETERARANLNAGFEEAVRRQASVPSAPAPEAGQRGPEQPAARPRRRSR